MEARGLAVTLAHVAASAVALGALALGMRRALDRFLATLDPDERLCGVATCCALVLVVSGELLGALGALAFPLWAGLVFAIGAGTAYRLKPAPDTSPHPGWLKSLLGGIRTAARAIRDAFVGRRQLSLAFRLALGGVIVGRLMFALRNPPTDRDSLDYHLPMIAHWISTGTLGVSHWLQLPRFTNYPGSSELLGMWAAFATGRDTLVAWPAVLELGLAAIALRGLMVDLGIRRRVAEALTFSLVAAPGVIRLTQGLSADLFMAAWLAIGLRFLLRYRRTEAQADAALGFAALGLASGARYTAYPLAAIVAVCCVLIPNRAGRRVWPSLASPAWPALIVPGGFWLVRSTLTTGNPLYPLDMHLGPLHLTGNPEYSELWDTTQLGLWRAGFAGHLTPVNLWRVFGVFAAALAVGAIAFAIQAARTRRGLAGRDGTILAVVAIAGAALFLISPYSGANLPVQRGGTPSLVISNLRYLMPALIGLAPFAAAGLSGSALWATLAALALGAGALIQLRPFLGHIAPGALAASAWIVIARFRIPRPVLIAAAIVALIGLADASAQLERPRAAITREVWKNPGERKRVLAVEAADRALALAAGGRPIAIVGLEYPYELARPDLSWPCVYVPVSAALAPGRRWQFVADDRAHAAHDRWLRNLAAARAAAVLVMTERDGRFPVERSWCDADPARFRPDFRDARQAIYEVRGTP